MPLSPPLSTDHLGTVIDIDEAVKLVVESLRSERVHGEFVREFEKLLDFRNDSKTLAILEEIKQRRSVARGDIMLIDLAVSNFRSFLGQGFVRGVETAIIEEIELFLMRHFQITPNEVRNYCESDPKCGEILMTVWEALSQMIAAENVLAENMFKGGDIPSSDFLDRVAWGFVMDALSVVFSDIVDDIDSSGKYERKIVASAPPPELRMGMEVSEPAPAPVERRPKTKISKTRSLVGCAAMSIVGGTLALATAAGLFHEKIAGMFVSHGAADILDGAREAYKARQSLGTGGENSAAMKKLYDDEKREKEELEKETVKDFEKVNEWEKKQVQALPKDLSSDERLERMIDISEQAKERRTEVKKQLAFDLAQIGTKYSKKRKTLKAQSAAAEGSQVEYEIPFVYRWAMLDAIPGWQPVPTEVDDEQWGSVLDCTDSENASRVPVMVTCEESVPVASSGRTCINSDLLLTSNDWDGLEIVPERELQSSAGNLCSLVVEGTWYSDTQSIPLDEDEESDVER